MNFIKYTNEAALLAYLATVYEDVRTPANVGGASSTGQRKKIAVSSPGTYGANGGEIELFFFEKTAGDIIRNIDRQYHEFKSLASDVLNQEPDFVKGCYEMVKSDMAISGTGANAFEIAWGNFVCVEEKTNKLTEVYYKVWLDESTGLLDLKEIDVQIEIYNLQN